MIQFRKNPIGRSLDIGPEVMYKNIRSPSVKIPGENGIKAFYKLLKMAENIRAELTWQRHSCVPLESRHDMCKLHVSKPNEA